MFSRFGTRILYNCYCGKLSVDLLYLFEAFWLLRVHQIIYGLPVALRLNVGKLSVYVSFDQTTVVKVTHPHLVVERYLL